MLDIGGGYGIFSFYAACMGAEEDICLKPLIEGADARAYNKFRRIQASLCLDQVKFESRTLQAYDPDCRKFYIILLHNSINHLDERACINLLVANEAWKVHSEMLSKMYDLSRYGASLILCDCSNNNLFQALRVRNPFAPSIEWYKHQSPEVWTKILTEVGFTNPRIHWFSIRMGSFGRLVLENKLMSYLTTSHFCLRMEKA